MKKIVRAKGLEIGQGVPKVCVSLTGRTEEELLKQAEEYSKLDIDILEWRVDYFAEVEDIDRVKQTLENISYMLEDKPLIFTFRSKKEGGEKILSNEEYAKLNEEIIKTKLIDIVDIELFIGDNEVKYLIDKAHDNNLKVIVSNHDFSKTPSEDVIVKRLEKMIEFNADLPKIAVMPRNQLDVLTLLKATCIIRNNYNQQPIITMSMGSLGMISRLSGEIFGSALTFGCVENVSAPGQIYYKELKDILKLIDKNISSRF